MSTDDLPAMAALGSDEHRAFVQQFCEHGNRQRAYLEAFPSATKAGVNQSAYRLLQRRDIKAAIQEWSGRQLSTLVPDAVRALSEILADPFAKSRASVAEKILERAFPTISRQEIHVTRGASQDQQMMVQVATRMLLSGATAEQVCLILGPNSEGLHAAIAAAREKLHLRDITPPKLEAAAQEFDPNETF